MNLLSDHIIRSRQGDKEAFRQIVQQFQSMVFSLAFRMLCDEDDAEDIVQETFIRVWSHLSEYDENKKFETWVYTIAYRLCMMELRRKERIKTMPDDLNSLADFISVESADVRLENKDLAAILRLLVDRLSPKQKAVFILICIEDKSTDEVSVITGMNPIQIKSNLYLARKAISNKLKKLGYGK